LFPKDGNDGINGVAFFKLLGEGVIDKAGPCFVFISLESSVEEDLEGGD
jgi:hypothetical protein